MTIRFKQSARLLALAAMLAATTGASAQSAGQWMAKIGVNRIMPKVKAGEFSAPTLPGSSADVSKDTEPALAAAYMFTDNISAELALGAPFKHDLIGRGMIDGVGTLGTVKALPPTLFAQYRFLQPNAMFRPYVGVGVTYADFQKERGSAALTAFLNTGGAPVTFELDSKFAGSVQLGSTMRIHDRWFADVAVVKTWLKTTANFSTGQHLDARLDPVTVQVAIGYQF